MFGVHKPKFLKPDDDSYSSERDALSTDDQVTSFIFNSNHSLSIEAQRERLPIRKYRDQILYCLENHQILILVGETGSGKSTQVPQYLLEYGWYMKGLIGITEPRRVSAITLAERVSEERGEIVGQNVGVAVRFIDRCTDVTKIRYVTEGILISEMLVDPLLSKYGVIMVDEAHERNILTDTLLSLLKKILKKRDNLRLIISSATIDAEFFKDFFNVVDKETMKDSAICLTVEGRMYSTDIFYLQEPCPDYVTETVKTILEIHQKEGAGDILAFLTGQEEVLEVVNKLKEYRENVEKDDLQICPLYGTLSNGEQLKAFFAPPKGARKVVVATNIAETSVTIPGIVYVIDCGFVKMKVFNAASNTDTLSILPTSKAAAEQRAGRAGRIRDGKVYRLYTEDEYEKLPNQTVPEIRRSDLCTTILHLKALAIKNVLRFDFPSPPPVKNLMSALETLYALGALDDDAELTNPIGYFLAEFPISAMTGKMLYMSCEMGCSEEILSIIAMMQVQSVFSKPVSGQGQITAKIRKREFEVAEGDLITLLNVFTAFVANGRTKEWCGRHYLIYRNLKRAYELREQLEKLARNKIGMPIISCNGDVTQLQRCITAGFFPNAAYFHHSGVYKTIRGNTEVHVAPNSALYSLKPKKFIVFCDVVYTTKLFVSDITVIQENWLTELAPHYYQKTTVIKD